MKKFIERVAEANVPVYFDELLEIAKHERYMVTNIPKRRPLFDGTPTPVNLISTNMYEYFVRELRNEVRECEELRHLVE